MKKSIKKSIIALTLIFAMSVGLVASAAQYDNDVTNGEHYDVPYNNINEAGNWYLTVNRDNVPLTITFTREGWSLGWNIKKGADYIDYSDLDAKNLTVTIKNNVPLGRNVIDLDVDVGGRVYFHVHENVAVTYSSGKTAASNMPSNTTVDSYGTITLASNTPTATGYTFSHWLGSDGNTYSPGATVSVNGDVSFTAQWTAHNYTVNYDGNGATSGSTASQTFTWDVSKALASNGFKRVHTVTYNANGGTASKTSENAEATFNGWEDRNSMTYNGTTYSASNFDAPYYANTYGDLYNAFGYNKYKLVEHFDKYITHGTENRKAIDPNGVRSYYYASRLTVANLTDVKNGTVTMHANWTPKSVTLPTATKTGYTLKNWLGSNGTTYAAGASVPISSNMTFTAQWTPNIYKVTLDNQGATTAGTAAYWYKFNTTEKVNGETVYYWTNEACTTPLSGYKITVPTKTGYTFGGYWTAANGGGTQYVDASGTCINNLYAAVAGNTTLYAKWTAVPYTISYNLDGGSVSGNPTSYNVESNAITLNNPTKEGYTFAGWTGTGLSSATASVTIPKGSTGNRSYTATWTPISYTVRYEGNGATSGSTASQTFTWNESKALSANGFKKEYTVTYNANGGTASKASETAASTFNGWEDRNDIIYNGVTYLWTTFDAPYYANRYTDLYDAFNYNKYGLIGHYVNNGMGENRDPIDPDSPTDPNDPNYRRSYYRADRLTVANLTTVNNGEVVLIANWTPKNVNLPTATKTGYTFDGWLGSDGVTYAANAVVPITSNMTFTAQWSAASYTIDYNLNGGSVSGNPTSYTIESNAITLKNPTKTGYTFTGWTGSGLLSATTSVTIAKGSTGNRTYTANWSVESYEITYDYNGGTDPGNPPSFTVESGEITLKPPTKPGYIFDGWTGSNGSTPQKDVTISANSTGEKTYTANWTAESYTISYNLDGGNDPGNPTSYTIESSDISLKAPTRTGYTFTGWTGSNGSTAQTSVTIPTGSMGNKSYTATWVRSDYTIKWVNHDGTLLFEEKLKYNTTPTYGGEAPTRTSTAEHDFTFSGWSPEIAPATEDATYTAQYTSTVRKYAITFRNEDGTVLETKEVEYGKTPTYTGSTPTKAPTESEVFTFKGWSPELGSVTGEAEYTATYTSAPRKYNVTWKNGETVLMSEEYEYNAMPTYKGEEPTKDKDKTYSYEFAGWDPALSNVITDMTYSAVFTPIELPPVADLTIVTTDCDEAQSFVFSVESLDDAAFAPIEVSIVGNGKAVIKDVPAGKYKVTEETEWTWRYNDVDPETVDVSAGDANTATFEKIKVPAIVKWLSGLAALFK